MFWIIVIISIVHEANGFVPVIVPFSTSGSSNRLQATKQSIERAIENSGVEYDVLLEPVNRATITAGSASNISCNQTINITGNSLCLSKYYSGVSPREQYEDYISQGFCNSDLYSGFYSCNDVNTPDSLTLSNNPDVIGDGDLNTAWIHAADSQNPVTIALDLKGKFKVYMLILVLETVPRRIEVTGKLGNDSSVLAVMNAESCDSEDPELTNNEQCVTLTSDLDLVMDGNVMSLFLGVPDVDAFADKLLIKFESFPPTNEYNADYIVLSSLRLLATCACERGECSETVNQRYPESIATGYSCKCEDYDGFLCDRCATDTYISKDVCVSCDCDVTGSLFSNCTKEGDCMCNRTRLPDERFWGSKCEESYVVDVTPRVGPLRGGTIITIKGGLLSKLSLTDHCSDVVCPTSAKAVDECSNRDVTRFCEVKEGESLGTVPLVTARNANRTMSNFTFTYLFNPNITDISPLKSFASGGINITVSGTNLDGMSHLELVYHVSCGATDPTKWEIKQTCAVESSTKALCLSLDLCDEENRCKDKTLRSDILSCGKDLDALGNFVDSTEYKLSLLLDGNALEFSESLKQFSKLTITSNPQIFKWENSLKTIKLSETEFKIPGERLNFGAELEDYVVEINGVVARPIRLSVNRLDVEVPDGRPSGNTIVKVGRLSKDVGDLMIESDVAVELIVIPVVIFVVILILIIVVILVLRKKRHKVKKLDHNYNDKLAAIRYVRQDGEIGVITIGHTVFDAQLLEELKPWLIEKERLNLSTHVGSGQFGLVYKGSIQFSDGRHLTVAAKTLKSGGLSEEDVNAFLKEATLMKDFNHPNVLSLIGVVYDQHHMPIVVLPYMEHGDIKSLIQKEDLISIPATKARNYLRWYAVPGHSGSNEYRAIRLSLHEFSLGDLLHFAMQVAYGMEYLSSLKFIHRDLAARNCMVDSDFIVKIADFGLSHDVYQDEYYRLHAGSGKPLPVKWMATESLTAGLFTTKSDVWSYGVVVWELLTRGMTPYSLVSNYEVAAHVRTGNRLEQPDYCPNEIYDVMFECWNEAPELRPTFSDIASAIKNILEDSGYQERSKTRNITDDYYLQCEDSNAEQINELYVQIVA